MIYDEKEVLNMLIVQARSLTKAAKLLEEAGQELQSQKAFIKSIFDEIKKEHYSEDEIMDRSEAELVRCARVPTTCACSKNSFDIGYDCAYTPKLSCENYETLKGRRSRFVVLTMVLTLLLLRARLVLLLSITLTHSRLTCLSHRI